MLPDPPEAADGPARNRMEIEQLVHKLAPQYAIDPKLVMAVISTESAFDAGAVSPKNAQGLMQLIPETAERFGGRRCSTPRRTSGRARLPAVAARFLPGRRVAGACGLQCRRARVEKYRGVPPYPETRNYVRKITSVYRNATHSFDSGVVEPSPLMENMKRAQR